MGTVLGRGTPSLASSSMCSSTALILRPVHPAITRLLIARRSRAFSLGIFCPHHQTTARRCARARASLGRDRFRTNQVVILAAIENQGPGEVFGFGTLNLTDQNDVVAGFVFGDQPAFNGCDCLGECGTPIGALVMGKIAPFV